MFLKNYRIYRHQSNESQRKKDKKKIEEFEGEEEKTIELILEMLERMNDEVADKLDMRKVVQISLNTEIISELYTDRQVI